MTQPWVTPAEFLASPTWLDSQDLVPGGNANAQLNSLNDVMLKASGWARIVAEQNLAAHTVFGQDRFPVNRWGDVYVVPENTPVRQVNGFAWGSDFQNLTALPQPNTQTWIERQETIIFSPYPTSSTSLTNFQFGSARPLADYVYAAYSYVAGYCVTTLSEAAVAGATEIFVTDPTGLMPAVSGGLLGTIPGSVARIWDPLNQAGTSGGEEAVQVSPSWVAGTNPVLLTAGLANNHAQGAPVDELPPEVHQAVIALAVGLLCREDVTHEEPYRGSPFGPTVRKSTKGGKAGGLINHAEGVLKRYRPRVH